MILVTNLKISFWDVRKMLGLTKTDQDLYIHGDVTEHMLAVHQKYFTKSDFMSGGSYSSRIT